MLTVSLYVCRLLGITNGSSSSPCHPEPAKDPYSSRRDNGSFVVPPQDDMDLDEDSRLVVRLRGGHVGEQFELLHPAVGLLVHLAGIGLEDDPLAWAESAHVDQRLELVGHLAQVVVGELLMFDVDVALRAP